MRVSFAKSASFPPVRAPLGTGSVRGRSEKASGSGGPVTEGEAEMNRSCVRSGRWGALVCGIAITASALGALARPAAAAAGQPFGCLTPTTFIAQGADTQLHA